MSDEKDNNKNQVIFVAELTPDKQFSIRLKTSNMMALSFAYKLLGLQIDNMIIGQQQAAATKKMIKVTPGMFDSLRKHLGGKN